MTAMSCPDVDGNCNKLFPVSEDRKRPTNSWSIDCRNYLIAGSPGGALEKSLAVECREGCATKSNECSFPVTKYLIADSDGNSVTGSDTKSNDRPTRSSTKSHRITNYCQKDNTDDIVRRWLMGNPRIDESRLPDIVQHTENGNDVITANVGSADDNASVHGRLQSVVYNLESLLGEMKRAASDIRDLIVHIDDVADYVHESAEPITTSGCDAQSDILRTQKTCSTALACSRQKENLTNRKCDISKGEHGHHQRTVETNSDHVTHQQQHRKRKLRRSKRKTKSDAERQQNKPNEKMNKQPAKWVSPVNSWLSKPDVNSQTMLSEGDKCTPTTSGSDQSAYSGIYERDLDEILESIAVIDRDEHECKMASRRNRKQSNSVDVQSGFSTCDSGCSDGESESAANISKPEEREENYFLLKKLTRFFRSGSWRPNITVIEP